MKTAKFITLLLVSLFLVGISSCGSDDEEEYVNLNNPKDIIGVWNISKVSFEIEGKDKSMVNALKKKLKQIEPNYKGNYTFHEDGTCQSIETVLVEIVTETGTYYVENSIVYIREDVTEQQVAYKAALVDGALQLIVDGTDLIEKALNESGLSLSQLQITKVSLCMRFSKKG